MRKSTALLAGLYLLLPCIAWPQAAHAYEDEVGVAAGFGYSGAPLTAPDHGLALEATVDMGLGPTWTLRGQAAYGRTRNDGLRSHMGRAGVEAVYIVDILDWVPSVGGGAGVVSWTRGGEIHVGPSLHATVGLDYLLSRAWSLGLNLRIFAGPPLLLLPSSMAQATLSVRYVLSD